MSETAVSLVSAARMPFGEPGAAGILGMRPLDEVLSEADLLIIGAPHPEYRDLATDKPVADIWNVPGRGIQV